MSVFYNKIIGGYLTVKLNQLVSVMDYNRLNCCSYITVLSFCTHSQFMHKLYMYLYMYM